MISTKIDRRLDNEPQEKKIIARPEPPGFLQIFLGQ